MATIPYMAIGPTAILGFIGLLHGPDKIVPTPLEDWHKESIDVLIPAKNEEKNIVFCLAALEMQTIKPRRVILIDDASTDRTVQFAEDYCKFTSFELSIIRREHGEGKTQSLKQVTEDSDANVLFVLDGDTFLRSENYIERLVQELYQGVGIACACGVVLPSEKRDRKRLLSTPRLSLFASKNKAITDCLVSPWYVEMFQKLTNLYREELYIFVQKFIYHTEMIFFGTIVNPVGCAVAYKREYVKDIFDQYGPTLGVNLTSAEDVFIGFSFADYGYRNIQVQDVYTLTQEPPLYKLPAQIFMWASAFLQCCYYFGDLLMSPFKSPVALARWYRRKRDPGFKKIKELRKVKEQYRQAFGVEETKKYGRPIGWYIFFSGFEKVSFPLIIILMIYFKFWTLLLVTGCLEILFTATLIAFMHRNRKIKNFFKSVLMFPIRYLVLMYDLFIILYFVKDLVYVKGRRWKK